MEKGQSKELKNKGIAANKRRLAAAIAVLLLAVLLCISILIRSNIQSEYAAFKASMMRQGHACMAQVSQLYERMEAAGADAPGKFLPEMRMQYGVARALSFAMVENELDAYAPLTLTQIEHFDKAFESMFTAYNKGTPMGLAKADLLNCINEIRPKIEAYFAPPEDDEEEVPTIDAISGKVQE